MQIRICIPTIRYIYLFNGKSTTGVSIRIIPLNLSLKTSISSSKFLFMACLVGFAIIMCYMLFCSSWLIYKGIQLAAEKYNWTYDTTTNFQIAMSDPGLRNMVISLSSTYGIYLISSCLHRQPFHMITSFLPYLLLLPGYINILNIYAFCNTHDVRQVSLSIYVNCKPV